MLIYNTTFHVDGERHLSSFLNYMRDVYVPAAIEKGYFRNPRLVRLLADVGDNLFGYALMCEVEDIQQLKKWKLEIGHTLESNFHQQFGEKILMFSTAMKDVSEKLTPLT
jgi:hypothetical protein